MAFFIWSISEDQDKSFWMDWHFKEQPNEINQICTLEMLSMQKSMKSINILELQSHVSQANGIKNGQQVKVFSDSSKGEIYFHFLSTIVKDWNRMEKQQFSNCYLDMWVLKLLLEWMGKYGSRVNKKKMWLSFILLSSKHKSWVTIK